MQDPATVKFQSARPYAVLPVSPALAALYSSTSSTSTGNPDWCSKCGSYLLNGGAEIRVVRHKSSIRHPSKRALRTICRRCRWKAEVLVEGDRTAIHAALPDDPISTPPSASSSNPPTPSGSSQEPPTQVKARNKKKSGLQLLLLKNREKESQERKGPASGGLAAFLSGL